ncbi:hypothetical protein JDV09_01675 [Mycobacterium sp. Y57]|uniref:hypothetical protein n=1 Tax=Mycolicibacterium xanthum TaxID=2796469 RepID=UPI001C8660E7|nr:hypothetical protein [Mycolicibacterium xanthum]MBX7430826.1 hypothetical protein [Mycolicibacterium xanthum]
MATQCTQTFDEIATALGGFSCHDAPAIVHLRNPFGLSNWTLPVLELLMVTIAVAALLHGVRRWRRDGDPVNLALWFATVGYLFVIEIPLYFPNVFGVDGAVGVVFAHNVFSVQFLFDRLPLYIVALYPAVVSLSYEVVRSLGVFRDRGILLGAVCVGFVHHCFYEVFDQLGPQLRWWSWNTANPLNQPWLASVPMTSVFIFATLGPMVVTALVMFFVARPRPVPRPAALAWRTVLAGALTPLGLVVLSIPTSLFGGDAPNTSAQAVLFTVELAAVAATGAVLLSRQWWRIRSGDTAPTAPGWFLRVFGPGYLGVLALLWVTALPDYFGAVSGVTADGTPIGCLPYAGAAFVGAALCLAGALTAERAAPRTPARVTSRTA